LARFPPRSFSSFMKSNSQSPGWPGHLHSGSGQEVNTKLYRRLLTCFRNHRYSWRSTCKAGRTSNFSELGVHAQVNKSVVGHDRWRAKSRACRRIPGQTGVLFLIAVAVKFVPAKRTVRKTFAIWFAAVSKITASWRGARSTSALFGRLAAHPLPAWSMQTACR